MYEIILSDKFKRQLKKLDKLTQIRIGAVIDRLKIRPFSCDLKRLQGSHYYRARSGKYRLILDIIQNKLVIFVLELGHRRNVYKS